MKYESGTGVCRKLDLLECKEVPKSTVIEPRKNTNQRIDEKRDNHSTEIYDKI